MKAVRGVQLAAKGVGEAFTGGRDMHQLLHALSATTVAVEAYFAQPCFQRILPDELKLWAKSLCGEAKEAHERLSIRIDRMEKEGVRGAAESSLHALSSAAGAITGIAILDVGRHIADELIQMTAALNDMLARATRIVTLANAVMIERLMEKSGLDTTKLPTAEEINPELTKYEVETVQPRLWVHSVNDASVVAGDKLTVTWETVGHVPMINVRLKNCMGVETSRGKTVLRLTKESGESNKSTVHGGVPFDFPPGKYTLAVSDPANNIRGMTFLSVLRPISVADIMEPPSGVRNLTWRHPSWSRGSMRTIKWKMFRGKANVVSCAVSIGTSSEGPWRTLRRASDLKFKVPDPKRKEEGVYTFHNPPDAEMDGASGGNGYMRLDKLNQPETVNVEEGQSLWTPEDGDEEDEGSAPSAGAQNVATPLPEAEAQEWFADEKVDGHKSKTHGAPAASMASSFSGFFGNWSQKPDQSVPPSHRESNAEAVEDALEGHAVIETMDCGFDWMVPLDLEPGKYIVRIAPTGYDAIRFIPEDMNRRARESGTIIVS